MKFPWHIIGHSKILEKIEDDIESENIAQSYLFCGPKEIGKFRLIKTFAQILQCEEKNLCRSCAACQRIEKSIHEATFVLDQLWIQDKNQDLEQLAKYSNFDQSHRKKSGKRSDQIGIDDIQVFVEPLWQTTSAPYKIALIRDAQRMTEGAMNTLLKILEEPPAKTHFFLTATHREGLLPTIISRTRVVEMGLVPNSILRKELEQEGDLSPEQQQKILTLSQGRSERFTRFLDDTEFLKSQDRLFTTLAQILKVEDISLLFAKAEFLAKSENSQECADFFNALLHFLRTLLREKVLGKSLSLGTQFSVEEILERIEAVEEAGQQVKRNVNKRLLLEQLLMRL